MKSAMVSEVVQHLEALSELSTLVARELAGEVAEAAEAAQHALGAGRKLLFCGNGGSAANAQHLAAEYIVRFRDGRSPVPAIALGADTPLLTATANDLGFDQIFARQIRALAMPGDILFLHSTSGESGNLIEAANAARAEQVRTVALLARGGGRLKDLADTALVVPTDDVAHAQELHLAIGHAICGIVERRIGRRAGGEG